MVFQCQRSLMLGKKPFLSRVLTFPDSRWEFLCFRNLCRGNGGFLFVYIRTGELHKPGSCWLKVGLETEYVPQQLKRRCSGRCRKILIVIIKQSILTKMKEKCSQERFQLHRIWMDFQKPLTETVKNRHKWLLGLKQPKFLCELHTFSQLAKFRKCVTFVNGSNNYA